MTASRLENPFEPDLAPLKNRHPRIFGPNHLLQKATFGLQRSNFFILFIALCAVSVLLSPEIIQVNKQTQQLPNLWLEFLGRAIAPFCLVLFARYHYYKWLHAREIRKAYDGILPGEKTRYAAEFRKMAQNRQFLVGNNPSFDNELLIKGLNRLADILDSANPSDEEKLRAACCMLTPPTIFGKEPFGMAVTMLTINIHSLRELFRVLRRC